MEQLTALLDSFRTTQSSSQRRALANQLHEQLSQLPPDEQTEARQEVKQFVLSEMNQAISQIESVLSKQVNHV